MRYFTCLLDATGRGISDAVRRSYESLSRSRGLAFEWRHVSQAAVLLSGDVAGGEPMVASDGHWLAVGTVRLDNRADVEAWADCRRDQFNDLELVLRVLSRHGTGYVPRLLGDFAFVVQNTATRTVVAACDAFAVKKLYHTERNDVLAFASRAEALALSEDQYEVQYFAELVATCAPSPGLTPYAGVRSLPAGTMAVFEDGRVVTHQYWSPHDFGVEPAWARSEHEAAKTCRQLLTDSVRLRLSGNGDTWSHLSGGMDSSSVVGIAQWLRDSEAGVHGLAGTVTYSDSHGTGADEREYSDAVVHRWRVRNETITDFPIWDDDQYSPPRNDYPGVDLVFYPRDCRLSAIVRNAGGRVLLTGAGGDLLFAGNMFFFADWVAHGRLWPAVREMARRAAIGRVSFWELAYRNAILPLLPGPVQHRLITDLGRMPPWVLEPTARRYGLHGRAYAPLTYAGPIGEKYRGAVAAAILAMGPNQTVGVLEDTLEVRHPFLYRPLVEFALRLPPELCVQPSARKWVLREAMRGILPEVVRTRIGKGTPYGLLSWWTATKQATLEPLIQEPILAELGVVDPAKLRAGFVEAMREGECRERLNGVMHHTLAIEAWLQIRSGRWPRRGHINQSVSTGQVYRPSI